MMNTILPTRRALLRVAGAFTAASHRRVLGANDRPRLALIGCGTRGFNALLPATLELKNPFVAVCDVFKPNLDRTLTVLHSRGGVSAAHTGDYRRIVERSDIDVVFIATPEHWHAQMAIDACKAGKDVYVEKPLAHTVEECMAIVEAARKYMRVVQVGLQQRSMKIFHDALAMLKDGVVGEVNRCETAWGFGGRAQPSDPIAPPPDGLDWEMFQGPAPRHPYRTSRQKGWHGYWDYGHGLITDVGVHVHDVARWFLGLGNPLSAFASALTPPDYRPELVPNVVEGVWRYAGGLVTYSSRNEDMSVRFWGEKGWLFVNRTAIRTAMFGRRSDLPVVKEQRIVDPGFEHIKIPNVVHTTVHVKNFLDAVLTRTQPSAPPEVGAASTIACLLGGRSLRTGKAYSWDGQRVKEL
jgi:predicted dehydrogenase